MQYTISLEKIVRDLKTITSTGIEWRETAPQGYTTQVFRKRRYTPETRFIQQVASVQGEHPMAIVRVQVQSGIYHVDVLGVAKVVIRIGKFITVGPGGA